eukprot:3916767-Rhodomonas_salina.1
MVYCYFFEPAGRRGGVCARESSPLPHPASESGADGGPEAGREPVPVTRATINLKRGTPHSLDDELCSKGGCFGSVSAWMWRGWCLCAGLNRVKVKGSHDSSRRG